MDGGDEWDQMIEWAVQCERERVEAEIDAMLREQQAVEQQLLAEWQEYERFMRGQCTLSCATR